MTSSIVRSVYSRLTTPSLVGRDRELSRVSGWVADLVAGQGRAALIEGEPGIGKSALLSATRERAGAAGCEVFAGAGDELGQALPLLPVLDAMRVRDSADDQHRLAIIGLLRGELSAGAGVAAAGAAAEHLLALLDEQCAAAPTVLLLDDMQWADQATTALCGRLVRLTTRMPLLLITVTRPLPRSEGLAALRRAVEPANRLRLGRLSDNATAELVATLAGGVPGPRLRRLADGAAGNPLYLTELVDALARGHALVIDDGQAETVAGPTPPSLSAAIADRLGFLPEPVTSVVLAAALIGVEFAVEDVAAVCGRGVAELMPALAEARRAGVITESGAGLAFRHPLIRTALYESVPAPIRAAWHRDAARALAAAGVPVERVARQLLPAFAPADGDADPADGWVADWMLDWLAGSAAAMVARAPAVAAELLGNALASGAAASARGPLLAARHAEALYRAGDVVAAERVAADALGHVHDADLLVDLHWTLTQCRALLGRSAESLAALAAALEFPGNERRHRARLLVLIARTRRALGEVEAAGRVAAQALAEATEADDRWAIGWSLHVLAVVAVMRGEVTSALPLFERGMAVTHGCRDLADLRQLLQINHAVALGDLDRYPEALRVADAVRKDADRVGNIVRLAQAQSALAELLFEHGRWDEALVEADALADEHKDPGVACCDHGVSACVAFHRDDVAAGRRHLAAAQPHAEHIGNRVIASLALARSLEREHAGDGAAALAVLVAGIERHAEELEEMEDLLPEAARIAVELGDRATAELVANRMAALAAGSEVPHRNAAAAHCQGLLDNDPAVLLRAAERYREAGRPLPKAQALEAAALAFATAGDRVSARAAFIRAHDQYAALDAAHDLGRLATKFRPLGIRRGPRAKHRVARVGWESLTPTELKVTALVVAGLSNPQIAARLYLSPRTVGTHVSHILAKLGVRSRIDIAREASRRQRASG